MRRDKTLGHTINVQAVMASVGESRTYVDAAYYYRPNGVVCLSVCLSQSWALTLHQSDTCRSRSQSRFVTSIKLNRNVMLLQQFLPTIRQISSEIFIFQQGSWRTGRLKQSTFPVTLPNVERF